MEFLFYSLFMVSFEIVNTATCKVSQPACRIGSGCFKQRITAAGMWNFPKPFSEMQNFAFNDAEHLARRCRTFSTKMQNIEREDAEL
jgi:hypothetical protein